MTLDICKLLRNVGALNLNSNELDKATKKLAASLLDPKLVAELMDSLTPQVREALNALTESNGRIPYANFIRQFGDIREMGAGKRDREHPHLKPSSTSEVLFYHALIARAFFDTDQGPQEFAYIPDDLFSLTSIRQGRIAIRPCKRRTFGPQRDTQRKSVSHPCNGSHPR